MQNQHVYDNHDQSYQLISSEKHIQALLRPLIEKHNLATISIAGCEEAYSSILLNSEPDSGEITIDGLHPHEGNTHFASAGQLTLDTQLDGIHLQFSAKLRASVEEDGTIHHLITYPENIRYWQRRQAFRASVSTAHNISVVLKTDKGKQCRGKLFDISIGGICIRFPRRDSIAEEFTKDAVFCSMNLPGQNHISCPIKITHSYKNISGHSLHVGAQFSKLDKIQHRAIERFVIELQRQQRQNAGS